MYEYDIDEDESYESDYITDQIKYKTLSLRYEVFLKKIIASDKRNLHSERDRAMKQLISESNDETLGFNSKYIEDIIRDLCPKNIKLQPDVIKVLNLAASVFTTQLLSESRQKAKEVKYDTVFPVHMQSAVEDMKKSGKICPFTCVEHRIEAQDQAKEILVDILQNQKNIPPDVTNIVETYYS